MHACLEHTRLAALALTLKRWYRHGLSLTCCCEYTIGGEERKQSGVIKALESVLIVLRVACYVVCARCRPGSWLRRPCWVLTPTGCACLPTPCWGAAIMRSGISRQHSRTTHRCVGCVLVGRVQQGQGWDALWRQRFGGQVNAGPGCACVIAAICWRTCCYICVCVCLSALTETHLTPPPSLLQAIRLDPSQPLAHLGTAQVYLAASGEVTNVVSELELVLRALPGTGAWGKGYRMSLLWCVCAGGCCVFTTGPGVTSEHSQVLAGSNRERPLERFIRNCSAKSLRPCVATPSAASCPMRLAGTSSKSM